MRGREGERPLEPTWLRIAAATFVGVVLSILAWLPMIDNGPKTPEGDGRYFLRAIETGKVAVRRYHELPLWNPFDCGGAPLWDNPEGISSSPILILATPLGGLTTLWLWNLFHIAAGWVSMWFFARVEIKATRLAAFAAASLWAFGVCHASQYAGAHSALISFMWMPLAVLLWRRAEQHVEAAVGLGLLVALMFFDGATYPIPHTALLLLVETLTRIFPLRDLKKRAPKIVKAALVVGVVAIVIGAPKIFPLIDQFSSKQRVIEPDLDSLARLNSLKAMYLLREHMWYFRLPDQQYVWGEYAAYIGPIVLVLALLGFVVALAEERWLAVLGIFLFVLMLGHFADFAPWSLLTKSTFPFKSMRVPARFRIMLHGFLAIYLALAIDRLPTRLKRVFGKRPAVQASRALLVAAALIGVGDVMSNAADIVDVRFKQAPQAPKVDVSPNLYYEGPGLAQDIDQARQNRGRLACADAWVFNHGAVWVGDVPQVKLENPGLGTVTWARRTSSTFTFKVNLTHQALVLANTNFERGWRSSTGTVENHGGLVAVALPAGEHEVKLQYWPKGLTAGFATATLGSIAIIFFFVRRRRRETLRKDAGRAEL